jgi:hypothetical protein
LIKYYFSIALLAPTKSEWCRLIRDIPKHFYGKKQRRKQQKRSIKFLQSPQQCLGGFRLLFGDIREQTILGIPKSFRLRSLLSFTSLNTMYFDTSGCHRASYKTEMTDIHFIELIVIDGWKCVK